MVRLLQLAVMVALRAEGSEQGHTPVGAGPSRAGSWQPAMDQELAKSPDKSLATTPTKAEGSELWASPGRSPMEVSVPRLLSTANEGTVGGRADRGPSQDPRAAAGENYGSTCLTASPPATGVVRMTLTHDLRPTLLRAQASSRIV